MILIICVDKLVLCDIVISDQRNIVSVINSDKFGSQLIVYCVCVLISEKSE